MNEKALSWFLEKRQFAFYSINQYTKLRRNKDDKIQDVLGHLQREFEGGFFTENLGAKFGGYGSFLPTYKRSPSILSQTKSPLKAPGHTIAPSLHSLSCEGTFNDLSNQMNVPISKSSNSSFKNSDLGGSVRMDASTGATTSDVHTQDHTLINKGTKDAIPKTLKVRIKVGHDNISVRNNADNCSGLGLELSASSSLVDTLEENKGTVEEDGIPNNSPKSILLLMSSIPISEEYFLSPLPENLLRLTKAGDPFIENQRGNTPGKKFHTQLTLPLRNSESCRESIMKPLPKNKQNVGGNKSKQNDNILEKIAGIDTEGHELNFKASNVPLQLSSVAAESKIIAREAVSNIQEKPHKGSKKTFDKKEYNRMLLNDNTFNSGLGELDAFNSKRSKENEGFISLKDEAVSTKEPCSRINLSRRGSVGKNIISGKNVLPYMQKECIENSENGINLNEVELELPEPYKEYISGANEIIPVIDPQRETMVSLSLFSSKNEKEFHARGVPENKSKRLKSQKDSSHIFPKKLQKEVIWERKCEQMVGWPELMATPKIVENRQRDMKIAKKKLRMRSVDNKSGIMSSEAPVEAFMDALICDQPDSNAAVAPDDSAQINDTWVCCDLCQKWRLLPSGMKPSDLPKQWECSLQFWLPAEMNSCIISEEITNVTYPQCHTFLPEGNANLDQFALSTSSATLHDLNAVNQVHHEVDSKSDKYCSQARRQSSAFQEMRKQKLKEKKMIKTNGFRHLHKKGKLSTELPAKAVSPHLANSNSTDNLVWENMGKIKDDLTRDLKGCRYSLSGAMNEDLKFNQGPEFKHVNVLDTQNFDKSVFPVKKRKAREWHAIQNNQETGLRSQHLVERRVVLGEEYSGSAVKEENRDTAADSAEEYSTSKMTGTNGKSRHRMRITSRVGKPHIDEILNQVTDMGQLENAAQAEQTCNVTTLQPSAGANSISSKLSSSTHDKANFQESQCSPLDSVSSSSFRVYSFDKFSKIKKIVGKTDAKNLGLSAIERSNRCSDGDIAHNMGQRSRRKEKDCFIQQYLLGHSRTSKFGGSPPDGACIDHFQESFSLDGGKTNNGKPSSMPFGDAEGNLLHLEVGGINVLNSVSRIYDLHDKHLTEPPDRNSFQNQDSLNEAVGNDGDVVNCYSNLRVKVISESGKRLYFRDKTKTSECELKKTKLKLSNIFPEQEELDSSRNGGSTCHQIQIDSTEHSRYLDDQRNAKSRFLDKYDRNIKKMNFVEEGKDSNIKQTDKYLIKMSSKPFVLHSPVTIRDNQGTLNQVSSLMSSVKTNVLECPNGEPDNGLLDLNKLTKDSYKKNVAKRVSSRHEKVNELDGLCPMRKCEPSSAAIVAMKEAKELKHAADRMKNVGQELESTTLYFQAALKFLQAASLSESLNFVSLNYEELNESLKIYTQTAALCEFCAHEYERRKDMAFAALAYKCMEVAYFKVAFFKNHVASKDHQELQETIQAFLQGDSPSSSASDLDSLNYTGALEKVTCAKVNIIQNAGSHIIASRPSFSRWLDFTKVSISALEASRKSQNALEVASANLGKSGCDSIASVKEALKFNFNNLEELLRCIRASMESFNH